MDKKLEYYLSLINYTYDELVEYLLKKYGSAEDDYFREKSYEKFINGEIKSISKGKITRTDEGLYCHHIDENKYLNLTNTGFIKKQKAPFQVQKKERLVYCDIIEHTILHGIIAKETDGVYGYPGFIVFLVPKIVEWYIDKQLPQTQWEKNCYNKSFLSSEDAQFLLDKLDKILEIPL